MKTKFLLLASLLLVSLNTIYAQGPSWAWAKSGQGKSTDQTFCVAADHLGNVYVAGLFYSDTIYFGANALVNASGSIDMFLVKYNAAGNVVWARSAGGAAADYGFSITTDVANNVIVAGLFNSASITFGATTLINDSSGTADIFMVKYNSLGNMIWARSAGGKAFEVPYALAADSAGNIFMTGTFTSKSFIVGNDTLRNDTTNGTADIFVIKYDGYGLPVWAKGAGGNAFDDPFAITTDAGGNVLITGYFLSHSIDFGGGTLLNKGGSDIFIAKYDGSGAHLWSKVIGTAAGEQAHGISSDKDNNVFLAGFFYGASIDFGSGPLLNDSTGTADMYIAKFGPNGTVLWSKKVGGKRSDLAYACAADTSGNLVVAGFFDSPTIDFGLGPLINTAADTSDIFVVKYDGSNGNALWCRSAGGHGSDEAYCLSLSSAGDVYIAGWFGGKTAAFGSTTLTNADANALGSDVFVAKLSTPVGIWEKPVNDNLIHIYANPASTTLTVQLTDALKGTVIMHIYDALGRMVSEETFVNTATTRQVNIAHLKAGVYFLTVGTKDGAVTGRFVKE